MTDPLTSIEPKQVEFVRLSNRTTRAHASHLLRTGYQVPADWEAQLKKLQAQEAEQLKATKEAESAKKSSGRSRCQQARQSRWGEIAIAQPLYFLPDLRKAAIDSVPLMRGVLKERGLTDVFSDVAHEQITVNELTGRGPVDKSGVVITYCTTDGSIPRRIGYTPAEQQWTPVGDGSLLWLGVDTAEPPKPEEMARGKQHDGYWLTLGDGNEWLIPVVRRPDGSTELPTDMVWDATGRFIEPIKPAYIAYWNESEEVADWFYGGEAGLAKITGERALELSIRALSLNYRFGRNEQNMLRVIDRDSYANLLAFTVDVPASQKKKSSERDAWLSGRLPAYRPSRGDLYLAGVT